MSIPAAQFDALAVWRTEPETFVRDILGITPEPWQARVLRDLAASGAHVSVRSGHGVGKSALSSWAILWHHATHYPAKTPCSAPTLHQLQDVLWSELSVWYRRMPEWLRVQFSLRVSDQDLRYYLADHPAESYAVARTGRKDNPEALQGFHSENLLFLLDEASGIDDVVFQVAGGALSTEGARVLMTSNPTRTNGYFFNSHHANRQFWSCHRVSCADSRFVSPSYITQQRSEYGEDSNVFRVRVLGEFPRTEDDVVVPLFLVEDAVARKVQPTPFQPVWGLDVARFGDDRTALAVRVGNTMPKVVTWWHGQDLMATVGKVHDLYRDAMARERAGDPSHVPSEILVDSIGIGAGVVDRLRELQLPVRGVNVGETPSANGSRFSRLRDELWWRAREWLEERDCAMVEDSALIGELTSVKYTLTSSGKLQVEPKDELKKRGLRSPDLADAWVLTFAGGLERKREDWVRKRYDADNRPRKSWRAA